MDEKLKQFIGKTITVATFADGTLTLSVDDDGDPNTQGTLDLTISKVEEDDIRCD